MRGLVTVLSHIFAVDAIWSTWSVGLPMVHTHVSGGPTSDIETINPELILADLETIDKRIGRAKLAKSKDTMQ